jgi:fructose-1,6-bisphosphatase/sedoheptulose 1,7-bisphosphatase-like protein
MISALELRHIIECGFLPLSCSCTLNSDGSLMIKVTEPSTGSVELLVTGVSPTSLISSRAIANLIAELRGEMAARKANFKSDESSAHRIQRLIE